MTMSKEKDDFYKGEDWIALGDAYPAGRSPHINKKSRCMCTENSSALKILLVLEKITVQLEELLVGCNSCGTMFWYMLDKRYIQGGGQ